MREILVSGYGGGETISIAKYRFSEDFENLLEIWRDNIESPTFLSFSEDMCFAITEKEKTAALFCYRRDGDGYAMSDSMAFDGGALCHAYYSSKHKTLYGACYLTGHVIAAAVENYKFSGVRSYFIMQPDREGEPTRGHCCVPDRGENRIFVCNIAQDRVYGYDIENGTLKTNEGFPYIQLAAGEGPRHIRFHPRMDVAYVITEYSNKIFVMDYDPAAGALDIIQEVSALPQGFSGRSYCSTLAFSPGGGYVYAANRGANTIGVFRADGRGLLEKIQDFDCGGVWPRHIDVTRDGRYLMVANQESGGIAVISASERDGVLKEPVLNMPFTTPSFVAEI